MELYPLRRSLEPELEALDAADFSQIATPWSDSETELMHRLFPRPDSLCLNFGRTAVFQWNDPNSSTLTHTTEWPQRIAGDGARRNNQRGITYTKMDPKPQMPYVIFRNMSPYFDSHANSGFASIKGMAPRFYSGRINTEETKSTINCSISSTSCHTCNAVKWGQVGSPEDVIYRRWRQP